MQRDCKDKCPLCRRGDVVVTADRHNLDPKLAEFPKKYLPEKVRTRQRENEQADEKEQFGDSYDARRVVM